MSDLRASDLAPNLLVGDSVEIDPSVTIGANVVIHAGTMIGADVVVQDGAVLGKAPVFGARSSASRESTSPLTVAAGAVICTQAVIFAGVEIGERVIVGDQAHVRERTAIGRESVVGRGSAIGPDSKIGKRVSIQTMVWLTTGTVVEDDVFIGPGLMTMNDNSMARCDPARSPLAAPVFRRACRVGGGVLVTPGVVVGEEAFVASGAVITSDVPPREKVRGVPARGFGQVLDGELLENWR
jgi:acetyltransferase-like isoleucine patch superfamily enzyme